MISKRWAEARPRWLLEGLTKGAELQYLPVFSVSAVLRRPGPRNSCPDSCIRSLESRVQ